MSNTQPEPSMDDILASIRRIISEDDETASPGARAVEEKSSADISSENPDAPADLQTGRGDATAAESDVFEQESVPASTASLPEATEIELSSGASSETGEVFGEITPDTLAEISSPPPASQKYSAEDVFEAEPEPVITADVTPVESTLSDEPLSDEASSYEEVTPVSQEVLESSDSATEVHGRPVVLPPESPLTASPQQEWEPPMTQSTNQQGRIAEGGIGRMPVNAGTEGLLATASTSAAVDAFETLSENMRIATGEGSTLEDVVERLLEPMLKNWLDMNLPRIVEEKVEDEVRRIARRR